VKAQLSTGSLGAKLDLERARAGGREGDDDGQAENRTGATVSAAALHALRHVMPFQSEALKRPTTVNPEKWLAILQRWHPRMPREELVDFINRFIEAAGLQRVEGLDALFVHVDKTTRSAQEKFDKLRHWTKKMRSNPLFWPHFFERHRPVSVLIKKIVDESSHPLTRFEVERKFRRFRKVPSTGLTQELKELANRGEIDRHKLGLYWRRGTAPHLTSRMLSERTSWSIALLTIACVRRNWLWH
jgi:hypothetical protein